MQFNGFLLQNYHSLVQILKEQMLRQTRTDRKNDSHAVMIHTTIQSLYSYATDFHIDARVCQRTVWLTATNVNTQKMTHRFRIIKTKTVHMCNANIVMLVCNNCAALQIHLIPTSFIGAGIYVILLLSTTSLSLNQILTFAER